MTLRIIKKVCVGAVWCCLAAWTPQAPAVADSSQKLADIIIASPIPVLVDFWAPWCMPCRMIDPIIKEMKKRYAGRIEVMKINIDIHRMIAAYFRISAIPAVFIVKDKTVVKFIPGVQDKPVYEAAIEEVLAQPEAAPDSSGKSQPKEDGLNEGASTGHSQ